MKTVAIIEYGMGNLDSVTRAIEQCGGKPIVTHDVLSLREADAIILPGVGSFSRGMNNIRRYDLETVLYQQVVEQGVPFLGICLGMQLLASKGWEGGETSGLGWIEGEVKRLQPNGNNVRIPHVGWNEVIFQESATIFTDIPSGKDFYFVHSYHFACTPEQAIIANTPYCGGFVSAVRKNNIIGVQFHPEKSQKVGFKILKNFLSI